MKTAAIIGIILIAAWACGWIAVMCSPGYAAARQRRREYQPRHTPAAVRAARPPVTVTVTADASQAPGALGDVQDRVWWHEPPPYPGVVEVLTGPHARIAATSELTVNVLARVRDALAALPDAPPDPAAGQPAWVTIGHPEAFRTLREMLDDLQDQPDPPAHEVTETRPQPALIAWDGKTPKQLADQLAAQYLTAPEAADALG